ncbi:MAG: type I restriction enzyme HsdR N-terminal domain-containing protein [Acidobacteria bacterium]|jgi:hypothetical protein|nr:type I restriction enzyme HsdR N-terminal domain-containing protein [Acidobacteriota bacterium]
MTINDLVKKYDLYRDQYLSINYNETQLRSDFIEPLFELLGWDIKNEKQKPTHEREVILEEPLKGSISESSKKPDYTFRLFSERKFFLEAKKPNIPIQKDDNAAKQIRRYGFTGKLKISILSNFEYLIIYDCSVCVGEDDPYNKALLKLYHYSEYEKNFEELKKYIGKDSVYTGKFDEIWKDIEDKIKKFSVDELFLEHINEWRLLLGIEIHKHAPDISIERLNDVVQGYLNSIIFLRVCEDRGLEFNETLLSFYKIGNFKGLIEKFKEADRRYNSGLFELYLSEKIIENNRSIFWQIIGDLYYPDSPYSFSVFPSDLLGNIYEIFLSEKLVFKEDNIFNGIQTSKNSLYVIVPIKEDSRFIFFENNGLSWKIEKELTRPYYQTPKGKDDERLNTYRVLEPNSRVIFPYEHTSKGLKVITLNRQFTSLKSELGSNLEELYALGADDDTIPLINQLYATN